MVSRQPRHFDRTSRFSSFFLNLLDQPGLPLSPIYAYIHFCFNILPPTHISEELITGLVGDEGNFVKSNDNIGPLIMNYFVKLLTSEVHVPDIGVLS
jgi:hypothetical protein